MTARIRIGPAQALLERFINVTPGQPPRRKDSRNNSGNHGNDCGEEQNF